MAQAYVEVDGDTALWLPSTSREVGELVRRLHRTTAPAPLRRRGSWPDFVLGRIGQRVDAVRRFVELPPTAGILDPYRELVEQRRLHDDSLLHMDVRADNVLRRDGKVVALIDFMNAVAGDPLFELARIRSYGLLDAEFLDGYGVMPDALDIDALMDLYELDTAALLTVVGVDEVDDQDLHRASLARTVALCASLESGDRY